MQFMCCERDSTNNFDIHTVNSPYELILYVKTKNVSSSHINLIYTRNYAHIKVM